MVVVDASVVVQWLFRPHDRPAGKSGEAWTSEALLAAPHLIDAEVGHAIRRQILTGRTTVLRADRALVRFLQLSIERFPHTSLLERAFELRDNASMYDALYLALAEALAATLLTRDAALAKVPGVGAKVEVVA